MALVLALEDDRLSQRLIQKIFKNAGHEVLLADSIRAGISLLCSRVLVDLVVLDSHLGLDVGWDFVSEVRRRPLFQQLPIIVYTGYTERQEVLRYAALKVQAVHVKPIKAEVLLAELERATKNGERSQVLQAPDEVCARLKIERAEYAALLLTAVKHLQEDHDEVERHLGQPRAAELGQALQRLRGRARELGIRRLDEMAALVADQAQRGDHAAARESAAAMDAVVLAVRHQAAALLGPTGGIAPPEAAGAAGRQLRATPPPPLPSSDLVGMVARQVIDRPLWMFADRFGRLPCAKLDVTDVLTLTAAEEAAGAIRPWLDALATIQKIPRSDVPDAARLLSDLKDFGPLCRRIAHRHRLQDIEETTEDEEEIDYIALATRLGVVPSIVLAALARLLRTPLVSPLELQPLRQHVAVTALVSLELARLFRQLEPHAFAAAAIGHQLGLWTLAVVEPGLTALALARASAGFPLPEAVQAVFGLSSAAVAAAVLPECETNELLRQVARAGEDPAQAASPAAQVVAAMVQLAATLARAAGTDDPQELKAVRSQLLQPQCATWAFLRTRGVEVPLDVGEIVEVIITLATSAAWTVREAAG